MAGEKGFTLWFTGLSGAGKTTISRLLEGHLRERGSKLEILDGDVVRENLSKGLGFSKEDRDTNIRRIAFVADLLSRNGVPVITAAISPYAEIRDEAHELMGDRFIEVYVKASVDTCASAARSWRSSTATSSAKTSPRASASRRRIATSTSAASPSSPTCSAATACR
jgi:adenylyl-sulfate kinase